MSGRDEDEQQKWVVKKGDERTKEEMDAKRRGKGQRTGTKYSATQLTSYYTSALESSASDHLGLGLRTQRQELQAEDR